MRFQCTAARGASIAAAMALGIAPVAAQETLGEISATIDGAAFAWQTLASDGSGTDYNTGVRDLDGMLDVSLMGFPPGRIAMRDAVQLTFLVMPGSLDTLHQEVIYAPEGVSRMWTTIEGEDLITIEHFDADAPFGEVSGRFAGRVCLKDGMFAEPDPATCKEIDGSFTSRLPHTAD